MAEDRIREKEALTEDDLERQQGEELPEREAMSAIDANVAAPINAAVAPNVPSEDVETEDEEIGKSK